MSVILTTLVKGAAREVCADIHFWALTRWPKGLRRALRLAWYPCSCQRFRDTCPRSSDPYEQCMSDLF